MPRPPRYDVDDLLDAALALTVAKTPTGVSVAGLARHAGVPSGSVYHRFPSRTVLLGELWLRTVDRFQEGFLACLADRDACRGARTAARYVVDWSRAHPDSARLLLYSRRDFVPEEWPAEQTARAAAQDRRLRAALRALAGRLEVDLERLAIAVVDLPYAVVRRHLADGGAIASSVADTVENCADTLLRAWLSGPQR
ncbi:TetR/AcrR family transcriptional regulator [Nonomuraea mesophila]|uniref:TetR/AcrR family transcriptional regulator n=1 Tax=Nonomuraea mesophila TaxID=2530382 RepID=A0A4R5FPF4_9ACTN|nr:TetR/AcrR family transcriptional regulator [Nonomuraea mesophila]TDE54606.1 TetR/AcrR family transcriptional regulator [Nonomuraea mesophila]